MLKRSFKSLFYFIFILFSFTGISQTFNDIPGITGEIFFVEYTEEHDIMFIGGEELYISNDDGQSWFQIDNSIGSGLDGFEFYAGTAMSQTDYVVHALDGYTHKFLVSNDAGQTWTTVYSTSDYNSYELNKDIIDANNGTVMISSEYGVLRSLDYGQTWNLVVTMNSTDPSDFIVYNNQSQLWYVGADNDGIVVSSDDGATWSSLNHGLNGEDLRGGFASGVNTIISVENGGQYDFFTIDELGTITDTMTIIKNELSASNTGISTFGLTPNGDFLAENATTMYKLDTTSNELYLFVYPGIQVSYSEGGMDLGIDIGIAFHSTYHSEQAYLIDYSTPADFFVSGNFSFLNANSTCAGDDLIAEISADHADSVRWYIDNQYYSSSNTLVYPTVSNQYVTYSVKTEVFYNGIMSSQTKSITLDPPATPIGFTYSVDTTPCFGNPLPIQITSNSGNQGQTLIQVDYNGQTVYGPTILSSGSMNLWIPNIVEEDTFQLITSTTDPCSNNADTIVQGMTVGPNLLEFDHIAEDSEMCVHDSIEYKLYNTNPNWSYDIETQFTLPYGYNPQPSTYQGVLNDSLTYYSGTTYLQTENVMSSAMAPIYFYLNIEVNAPNGCSQSSTIDTVRVYRPSSYFRIHQKTYELDSATEISNYIPVNNRLWSSSTIPQSDISNHTDTVPLITSSIPGFHDVMLRNEPIPGCVDERTEYVQYAISSPSHENCSSQNAPKNKLVMRTKFDHEGNLYSIGCYRNGPSYMRAATYSLERFDGTDSVLWSIDGDFTGIHTYGAIIESIDFDKNNDVVCVGWLSYEWEDYDDGIMVSSGGSGDKVKIFVFKLDGDDGSLIWNKEITTMPIDYNGSMRLRPTDIVVTDDNIYVSMYKSASLQFLVLDSLGNFVQHDKLDLPWAQTEHFIGAREHIPTSTFSWERGRYDSPRIKALSNGDIIAMGRFRSGIIPGIPQFDLGNDAEFGLFAFKYNMVDGLHDFETIGKTGFHYIYNFYLSQTGIGDPLYFDVDDKDNIYVGSHIHGTYFKDNETLSVLDSVLPKTPQSYVFKMNKNYDMEWLTLGTHSFIQGLKYNRASHELLLSGAINESIGFSSDTVHIYNGKEIDVIHDSTTASNIFQNYYTKQDVFLASIDTSGNPSFVEVYDLLEFTSPYSNSLFAVNSLASSPCGDYALHISNQASNWLIDQDTVAIDSIKIITGSTSQNCNFDCRYFVPDDTLRMCSSSQLDVFPADYFNIDSILYSISANGNTVVSGQYAQMLDGALQIPVPTQLANDSSLVISYDNTLSQDSTFVYFIAPPSITYEDTICQHEIATVEFNTGGFTYLFDDTLLITGNTYSIPQNNQYTGENRFPVISTHINNIVCYDTVSYEVIYSPYNVTYNYDSVFCDGDNVTFTANSPYNYDYEWLFNGDSGEQTIIEPLNYSMGNNETYVVVTHYNGCQLTDTLNFTVENCAGIDKNQSSSFVISPNPNNGKFEIQGNNMEKVSKVSIVDATGKIVEMVEPSKGEKFYFNLSIAPGTYYVHLEINEKTEIRKIIIK